MKKIISFKNKNIYIFGGSSGIGLSIAKEMASNDANVIIFARTKKKLISAIKIIKESKKSVTTTLEYMIVDVSDNKIVESVISHCVKTYGIPDILINCAGRAYPHHFKDITYEQFDETMKINLYGTWNTCAAAIPYMKKNGGWIVNTSSIAGFIGVYGYTDYAASKFAVMGFSESLRSELEESNISVSLLCPPDTSTPGFEIENETKPEETVALSKNAKTMTSEEVAKVCLKGIKKGKKIILPGLDSKIVYLAKRFIPSVVEFMMKQTIKKVQKDK
jgi:3-dehydrosphinganine reductase